MELEQNKILLLVFAIISVFSMIYGNLTLIVIGKKNMKYAIDNLFIAYTSIFIYILLLISSMYSENITENILNIVLYSILVFIIVILLLQLHPFLVILFMTMLVIVFIYISSKKRKDNI